MRSRWAQLAVLVGVVVIGLVLYDGPAWRVVAAAVAAALIFRLGMTMISGLAQPPPEPPDPGVLRKVKLTYQCSICGTEVKMTVATNQDPEPPRHCMEDMVLLTPIDDL